MGIGSEQQGDSVQRKTESEHFESFDLTIDHVGGTVYRVALDHSPEGRLEPEEVHFDWFGTIDDPEGSLQTIGRRLFETTFTPSIAAAYRASVRKIRHQPNVGLRICLALDGAPRLAKQPWEAMWDPLTRAYLSDRPYLVVVRTLHIPEPTTPPDLDHQPLCLLALIAEPKGERPLAGRAEWSRIANALERPVQEGRLQLRRVEPPTLLHLGRYVEHGPCHILHVVAHGSLGAPGQGGIVHLEDEAGEADEVDGSELLRALEVHHLPRLVVLNICHGGASHELDAYDGLAQILLRRGVAAVVAMRDVVSDAAAVGFANVFYRKLARGRTVEGAMVAARRELGLGSQRAEVSVPVLYTSGSNLRLGEPVGDNSGEFEAMTTAAIQTLVAAPAAGLGFWRRHRRPLNLLLVAALLAVIYFATPWLKPVPVCKAPKGLKDLEFVLVPVSGFESEAGPPPSVREPFCISTTEVTRRDWLRVMGAGDGKGKKRDRKPVVNVSPEDAQDFMKQLMQQDPDHVYRLPTQDEWIWAASAGAGSLYFFGDDAGEMHEYGNCRNVEVSDSFEGPAPVGSFLPNRLGLYDVHGNVAEWVEAKDPNGEGRRLRMGGSFDKVVRNCAVDKPSWIKAEKDAETGFRVVREIPSPPEQ